MEAYKRRLLAQRRAEEVMKEAHYKVLRLMIISTILALRVWAEIVD